MVIVQTRDLFLNSEIMRRSINKLRMFIKICIFMNVESKQRFILLLSLVSYIHCYYYEHEYHLYGGSSTFLVSKLKF